MKENINEEFFNGMLEKSPNGVTDFLKWVSGYFVKTGVHEWAKKKGPITFYDLPFGMQKGIIHEFVKEKTNSDMINFTMEGCMKDFEKVLEHLQDKVNYKSL